MKNWWKEMEKIFILVIVSSFVCKYFSFAHFYCVYININLSIHVQPFPFNRWIHRWHCCIEIESKTYWRLLNTATSNWGGGGEDNTLHCIDIPLVSHSLNISHSLLRGFSSRSIGASLNHPLIGLNCSFIHCLIGLTLYIAGYCSHSHCMSVCTGCTIHSMCLPLSLSLSPFFSGDT